MLIIRGYKMKKELLKLRFEGSNDIDLKTLSNSLNCVVETLSEIADETLNESDFCKFKVKAISKGSFVIDVEQIIETTAVLFPYMPTIIESFNTIMELRKTLAGKVPKKVIQNDDSVEIHAENSHVTINRNVYNIYRNNQSIENSLSDLSKTILGDSERTGLSIESGSNKVVMTNEDLLNTSQAIDVNELNGDVEENIMTTKLVVKQPDLGGNSKWKFKFNGRTIAVDIEDQKFMDSVKAGDVNFHAGMEINAEVLVRYINETVLSYKLLKVIEVIG